MQSDNQWLIAYLNEVLSVEVEIHSTKTLMEQLESMRIELLTVPEKFVPPDKPERPDPPKEPKKPNKDDYLHPPAKVWNDAMKEAGELAEEYGIIAAVVLAGVGLFAAIMWSLTFWLVVLIPLIVFGIAFIVCPCLALLWRQVTASYNINNYNAALRNHEAQIRKNRLDYENLCRQKLIRYKAERETEQQRFVERKNTALVNNQLAFLFNRKIDSSRLQLEAQLIVLESSLKSLYAMNEIHPQYHNLVAVSSIVSYLETGRCSSLRDADGAYDTYEDALLQQRIISKLAVIIEKLDQIQEMQHRLFVELTRVNENLAKIETSINEGLEVLQAQAKANARRFLELSVDISQMNLDMGSCFHDVENHLAKLEKTNDKALAYLKEQGKH